MHTSRKLWLAALPAVLILVGLVILACQGSPPPVPLPGAPPAPPAAATVVNQSVLSSSQALTPGVAVVTREAVRQVVVTATPTATPGYVSHVEAPPGTLLYPLTGAVRSVDPQSAADDASLLVTSQLYEDLFYLQRDGSLAPGAAASYRASPNAQVYTVTLRSRLTWSGGQAITARDYVSGTCRLLAPMMGNPRKTLLTDAARLVGATGFASGARPDCSEVGVTALDDQTLQFTLEEPLPTFPQLLAAHLFLPAPRPDSMEATAEPGASSSSTVVPASSGPYLLADWQPGRSMTLVKNPKYWDTSKVRVDRIELPFLPDPNGQLEAYEGGRLHVAYVPDRAVAKLQADTTFKRELHLLPLPGTSFLGINAALTPTSDIRFRQALAAALDPQALLRDALHEPWHGSATRLMPSGLPGAGARASSSVAVSRTVPAKTLLAQAGYTPDNPPVVTFWTNREGHNQALAEGIAAALERSGIQVRLVLSSWDLYQRSLEQCKQGPTAAGADCNYNLYLAGWLMDSADPGRILGPVNGVQPATAYANWQDKDYADLINRARGEADPAKRAGLYDRAEQLALDEVVALPLFYYDRMAAVKPGVTYDFPEFGPPSFKYWELTQ